MFARPAPSSDTAAERKADLAQADVFRVELRRQVELLNGELRGLRSELARCQMRNETTAVRRIQRELRCVTLERRDLVDMLAALDQRFSPDRCRSERGVNVGASRQDLQGSRHQNG
ncbi:hypothetical protein [Mycolicibacterium rhodesiae]|uniref:Transposase n=1 Tax=Mycolicibacterium rhodesiae TaxID=36814 RepID=A0A1X0J5A6_MYCRH|nr:hypothetical protein [Mycolicibacterium rhodesiae]MCV7345527.1 hypothetical protein [Mycolicibacterium rhodesiae]ORB56926.1 hypothetical protein BST42_00435 [Mycolicibacterium rhodesiae]